MTAPPRRISPTRAEDATAQPSFDWRLTGWEGNVAAQLDRALAVTPAQRLAWLEEALELALAAGALPDRRPARASEAAAGSASDPDPGQPAPHRRTD